MNKILKNIWLSFAAIFICATPALAVARIVPESVTLNIFWAGSVVLLISKSLIKAVEEKI